MFALQALCKPRMLKLDADSIHVQHLRREPLTAQEERSKHPKQPTDGTSTAKTTRASRYPLAGSETGELRVCDRRVIYFVSYVLVRQPSL